MSKDPFHIDWSNTDFNDHEAVKAILYHLVNLVEALHRENLALKAENQRLKDENNRLKGEKGKPDIKPRSPIKKDELDKNPGPKKEWKKQSKLNKVKPPHPSGWGIVKGIDSIIYPFIPVLPHGAFWVGW